MKQKTIDKIVKKLGVSEQSAMELEFRGTGKTTAIALRTISEALIKPNTWYYPRDHYDTREANRLLHMLCKRIVRDLDLVGFEFNNTTIAVRFNLSELHKKIFGFELE